MILTDKPHKKFPSIYACVLLTLVIAMSVTIGCVNMLVVKDTESSFGADSVIGENPENIDSSPQFPDPSRSVSYSLPVCSEVTPVKSDIVTEVTPFLTPDPYPVLHGTRINATPQYRFLDRQPEFEKKYVFGGNATGLLVNVVEGPLYIVYTVNPQNDCLFNPESCRGTLEEPVQRPYLAITVRDNETGEIVAEDGYGREYSSDTGKYEFSISGIDPDSLTSSAGGISTNIVSPGPRRIVLYKEGKFHVTLEGNYLEIDLSIITGSSPDPLEYTYENKPATSAEPVLEPEEERW